MLLEKQPFQVPALLLYATRLPANMMSVIIPLIQGILAACEKSTKLSGLSYIIEKIHPGGTNGRMFHHRQLSSLSCHQFQSKAAGHMK